MAILTLQDIVQSYDEKRLLRGVSMVVSDEDRIGLLGANGSGKSTLLRILAGVEVPDHGRRTVRRGLRRGYLDQEPVLEPQLSIVDAVRAGLLERERTVAELDRVHQAMADAGADELENLLVEQAGLEDLLDAQGGHDIEHKVDAFIQHLGLAGLSVPCGALSGGERRRVALARLLLSSPDLLILDEPTNHLDATVTDWLEDYLLQTRCPLVLVTHDRYFLDRLVTRTVEIETGALHEYAGGYSDFLMARAARLDREQSAESSRLNLLRRETEWMRRGPPARSTKAKARIGRYHDLVDAAPERDADELEFRIPSGPRLGERVINVEKVAAGYGGAKLIADLDLEIGARTRIGIVGPNGAGKTTLLNIFTGELEPLSGAVALGSTVKFASIDQKRSDLLETNSVLEEVAGKNDYVHVDGRAVRIESFLEQFLFPGAMKHAKIGTLSGGERNRVLLAKLLCADGNVLILDEPTNDLDLMTLRVLEEALIAFPGVVIVVSHDRYFLDRVATRILYLDGSGNHRLHAGDLSGLLEKVRAEESAVTARPGDKPGSKPAQPGSKARGRKLSTRERAELEELPGRLAEAELRVTELDERLADPATWQDGASHDPQELTGQRDAAQAVVDELYARWEELEAIEQAAG
ncbi:MAG: ABC-F family ATP-binding cassette domain-containing protein [Planctomycetota bacterium]|nr:ABC-F family ATP-binding cassette domain-containing protein [Planctomycetota bacterium]